MNSLGEQVRLPPLHAPMDRELVARIGPWQLRRHRDCDERFSYLASRAFLHLQLWRPDRGISVLTPSSLTGGQFEIAVGWSRMSASTWQAVVEALPEHDLPSGSKLATLSIWLVVKHQGLAS